MSRCVSRFELVQWIVGDHLDAETQKCISDHVANCSVCKEKAEQIRLRMDEYRPKKANGLEKIHSRLAEARAHQKRRRFRTNAVTLGAVTAIAASIAVFVFTGSPFSSNTAPMDTPGDSEKQLLRYKGAMSCKVFVKRGDKKFKTSSGGTLHPGDLLRFVVTTDKGGYLSIFSIDSVGNQSPFYPNTNPAADPAPFAVSGEGEHELPEAVELDDSQGAETIVVLFSHRSFDRRKLHRIVAPLAADRKPGAVPRALDGLSIQSKIFRFQKAGPPR